MKLKCDTHNDMPLPEKPVFPYVQDHRVDTIVLYPRSLLMNVVGWTISTWSQHLGDVLVLTIISIILAASFWYCFSRAPAWSAAETAAPTPIFDYVLYLGCLVWCVELAYLENRFHVLSGQWDLYLLATAFLFFFLAIVSTIASCCLSLYPHSPDGSDSLSRIGRLIRTRHTGYMPWFTVWWSVQLERFLSASN